MREFFRPFRRKLGVVVLVVACAFMGSWVRSQSTEDQIALTLSRRLINYGSTAGGVYILIIDTEWPYDVTPEWGTASRNDGSSRLPQPLLFDFVREDDERILTWSALIISHLSISLPLALMSAYLILSKPLQPANYTDDAQNQRKICVTPQSTTTRI